MYARAAMQTVSPPQPLAPGDANRPRANRQRAAKQTPLRLSTAAVPSAATPPPLLRTPGLATPRASASAAGHQAPGGRQAGWLEVRTAASAATGRLYCALPQGGARLECYRDASDAAPLVHAVELDQCSCIHAEEEPPPPRLPEREPPADCHVCLGTTAGSVLLWAPRDEGPLWVAALRAALAAQPAFTQSPPPQPQAASEAAAAVGPCPVRSSPCVTPARGSAPPSAPPATPDGAPAGGGTLTLTPGGQRGGASARAEPPAWVPDGEALECPLCTQQFGFFLRRHHCRRCGGVFCGSCSDNEIELPLFGIGGQHRACNECFECHQDEGRLVMAVTRSRRGAPGASADATTLQLLRRIASTRPVGRLAWCSSERGESLLMLAAFEECNAALVAAILDTCGGCQAAREMADSRDPVALRGALHVACAEGHEGVLRALLAHFGHFGAEGREAAAQLFTARDKAGHTPLELAERRGHAQAVERARAEALCEVFVDAPAA